MSEETEGGIRGARVTTAYRRGPAGDTRGRNVDLERTRPLRPLLRRDDPTEARARGRPKGQLKDRRDQLGDRRGRSKDRPKDRPRGRLCGVAHHMVARSGVGNPRLVGAPVRPNVRPVPHSHRAVSPCHRVSPARSRPLVRLAHPRHQGRRRPRHGLRVTPPPNTVAPVIPKGPVSSCPTSLTGHSSNRSRRACPADPLCRHNPLGRHSGNPNC